CVLIAVAVRAVARRALGDSRSGRIAQRVGSVLASPAGIAIAALPYAACLLLQGTAVGGIHEPLTVLPSPALIAYLGAFVTGWALHAASGSLERLARQWPVHLAIGFVLAVVGFLIEVTAVPLLVQSLVVA